jgi:ketosteroid isomerase-like protein
MSQENLQRLQRMYEAWAAGQIWAPDGFYDPCLVYVSQANDPDPGPHYGVEAFIGYARRFLESWDNWRMEALEYREAGDSFVVRTHRSAHGRTSGAPIDDEAFHVWTFRGQTVIRLEVFTHKADALAAVGLSE